MKRKRKHIPLIERLASALADKLPAQTRDALRAQKVPARVVVALFTPDHIALHAFGGPAKWWNIDMRRRDDELKAKDRADTSRAAKAVRIDHKWSDFMRRIKSGKKPVKRKSRWPSRPMGKPR